MRNLFTALTITATVMTVNLEAVAATYNIDASHTTIGFAVKHMVVANVKGSFGEFSGTIDYDADAPEGMSASAVIQVASIDTKNADRDAHLRNEDFFDAGQFPEITFQTTSVSGTAPDITLTGDLTMKGVTKEISLPVELSGPITDPWGNERIGLSGETTINRKDFNINWSKTLDNGGLVVADNVKLIIEIEGIKQ
ncbi:MAG: YceI family protein [Kiritimatiellia bacterium]